MKHSRLSGIGPKDMELVYRAIMATAGHFEPREYITPEEFTLNTQLIRMEYGHVSDEAWIVGRGGFLKYAQSAPVIYRHLVMAEYFDAKARANIDFALARNSLDMKDKMV